MSLPEHLPINHNISAIEAYKKAFLSGEKISVKGLCGRILRGKTSIDFTTLTDDPNRKIVMLMGPDGLLLLLGKSGYEMLSSIGYTSTYMTQKISEGTKFKLVVFPESRKAKPATWINVINMVSEAYPQIAIDLHHQISQLQSSSFDEIQDSSGYSFAEVDKNGPSDSRFMTLERYLNSTRQLTDTRAFLYFSVYLKELFSGNGYTYSTNGQRGMQEYVTLNQPTADLGKHILLDLSL